MSDSSVAVASIARIESLVLQGTKQTSEVAQVLRDASIDRTIDGASTVTLDVYDSKRTLLRSGIFADRTKVTVDAYDFELVQVRKGGDNLSLVFEDLPIAALRRRNQPLKVSANTVTHIEFAERLVKEEGWLNFWVPPELRAAERTRVELSRGKPDDGPGNYEDSWTALGRIADERGWRRYVMNKDTIAYVPETYLVTQTPLATVSEGSGGVETIDFDFDTGKATATVKLRVRSGRWSPPVGSAVLVENMGPAIGSWIVASVSRSLFSLFIDVTLTKARPILPEPVEAAAAASAAARVQGSGGAAGALGEAEVIPIIPGLNEFAANSSYAGEAARNGSAPAYTGPGSYAGEAAREGNETYPSDPTNLVKIGQGGHRLVPAAAESFKRVQAAVGRGIPITDSYRSTASQAASYASDPSRFAKPGGSAHGEGRAVDVNLTAYGVGNMSPDPSKWNLNGTWKRLNEAFMAEGWCNYQYKNQTTKGKMSEPWHWAYKVCK